MCKNGVSSKCAMSIRVRGLRRRARVPGSRKDARKSTVLNGNVVRPKFDS